MPHPIQRPVELRNHRLVANTFDKVFRAPPLLLATDLAPPKPHSTCGRKCRALICISANGGQRRDIIDRGHITIQTKIKREASLLYCHVERSRDISRSLFLDVERFDSLTSRSLSLWPSRLSRRFPGCSVLHFGRNDRMSGTRWRLCIAKRLQGCDADCSTYNLVRPATWIRKASNSSALFLSSSWARACPIQSIPLLIDHRTRSGQPFRSQSKESLERMILMRRSGLRISACSRPVIYFRSPVV